jgi:hypothetical protein
MALRSFAFLLALPLLSVACSPDEDHHHRHADVDYVQPACGAITTCGACTPVLGCGWCQYEDGKGTCATGPDACGNAKPFRWNWDPETCPATAADAGDDAIVTADVSTDDAVTSDATAEATADDASAESATDSGTAGETAVDAAPVCKIPEAASASCSPTTGGSLCKDGQYTLGCHGSTPDASLKCEKALSAGSDTYHCCPCGT